MKIDKSKIIFCDIDDTITFFKSDYNAGDYVNEIFSVFASYLAASSCIPISEARRKIDVYADDLIWWDYPDFIADFVLPQKEVWTAIRKIHKERLYVHLDAVEMVKTLHSRGFNMCIISNNPLTGCLLKLEVAGLADLNGSRYFKRLFSTNIIRGMKSQTAAWKRAVSSLGVPPSEIITIGDSVKEDCEIPKSIGIGSSVIVDRKSDVTEETCDGYIRINTLRHIK